MATKAKIISDTVNPSRFDSRMTTFEVEAPRFLLAEVNTHRVLAKSAASSRAIPVKKRIEAVEADPFIPKAFGKNQRGMQSTENLSGDEADRARGIWEAGVSYALECAVNLEHHSVHKQFANRVLEPYAYYTGVITGTEWTNFFALRTHPDAQPEFKELAEMMLEAYRASTPKVSGLHMPYAENEELVAKHTVSELMKVSAARCARVSYRLTDGTFSNFAADLELCERLTSGGHLSPFDHQGIADDVVFDTELGQEFWATPRDHRHLYGFIPYRVQIERDLNMTCARHSYDALDPESPPYTY